MKHLTEYINEKIKYGCIFHMFEIDHRMATQPMVANMNAQDELRKHNNTYVKPNGRRKSMKQHRDKASEMTYDTITQGVKDNVGAGFKLTFSREEPDSTFSGVDFTFERILLLTEYRFVMEGFVKMSRSPNPLSKKKPNKIQIDYIFDDGAFYEAVYCRNGTVRDKKLLELDDAEELGKHNKAIVKKLLDFMSMCLYSVEDGKTTISNK